MRIFQKNTFTHSFSTDDSETRYSRTREVPAIQNRERVKNMEISKSPYKEPMQTFWALSSLEYDPFIENTKLELLELQKGNLTKLVCYLYNTIEDALYEEKYQICNKLYQEIDLDCYHDQILITMMSIAYQWKDRMYCYSTFYDKVKYILLKRHEPELVARMLIGW